MECESCGTLINWSLWQTHASTDSLWCSTCSNSIYETRNAKRSPQVSVDNLRRMQNQQESVSMYNNETHNNHIALEPSNDDYLYEFMNFAGPQDGGSHDNLLSNSGGNGTVAGNVDNGNGANVSNDNSDMARYLRSIQSNSNYVPNSNQPDHLHRMLNRDVGKLSNKMYPEAKKFNMMRDKLVCDIVGKNYDPLDTDPFKDNDDDDDIDDHTASGSRPREKSDQSHAMRDSVAYGRQFAHGMNLAKELPGLTQTSFGRKVSDTEHSTDRQVNLNNSINLHSLQRQQGLNTKSLGSISESKTSTDAADAKHRVRYSNEEKIAALDRIEAEPQTSLTIMAEILGIKYHTLKVWARQKDTIRSLQSKLTVNKKAKSNPERPLWRIEKALMKWFRSNDQATASDRIPISLSILVKVAQAIKEKLMQKHAQQPYLCEREYKSIVEFTCSDSWVKKVAKIYQWRLNDLPQVESLGRLNKIISQHPDDCVYTVSATVIHWRLMPRPNYFPQNNEFAQGKGLFGGDGDRLVVYSCTNKSGNHKLPLFVVGKELLPTYATYNHDNIVYLSHETSSVDCHTFSRCFEHIMTQVKKRTMQKCIILVDSETTRNASVVDHTGQLSVFALPTSDDAGSNFPANKGVSCRIKQGYRFTLLRNIIRQYDHYKMLRSAAVSANLQPELVGLQYGHVPILSDAIKLLSLVWKDISAATIQSWWYISDHTPKQQFIDTNDCFAMAEELAKFAVVKQKNMYEMSLVSVFGSTADNLDQELLQLVKIVYSNDLNATFCAQVAQMLLGWINFEDCDVYQHMFSHSEEKLSIDEIVDCLEKDDSSSTIGSGQQQQQQRSMQQQHQQQQAALSNVELQQHLETLAVITSRYASLGCDEMVGTLQKSTDLVLEQLARVSQDSKKRNV